MSESKQAAKSVLIIMLFTLSSKILGFLREALIAAKFGAGEITDTFFISLTVTTLFITMITKAISTTMIPVLSEIECVEGKKNKVDHTNNLLNIVMIISLIIIVVAWFSTPYILKILAYGFKGEQFQLAVLMTRIGLFSMFFAGIVGVLRGYLQSELRFIESAAADFPFNFVYMFFLIFLSSVFGIKGLMVASVIAVAAQITIQIPGTKKANFKYKMVLDLKDKYIMQVLCLIPPILLNVVINDINVMVDRSLASTLVEGSISSLNYATRINSLITQVFITSIITVMFPMFSKEANNDNFEGLKKIVIKGLNVGMLITIPSTVGIIVLANPIVQIAFERGAFDSNARIMTSGALVFYMIGLVGTGTRSILYRVYYALQDTKTPMMNGFIAVAVNVSLNLILIRCMAHRGLALATSISAIITAILLIQGLRKKIGSFGFMKSFICGVKSLIASVIMGVAVYFLYNSLGSTLGNSNTNESIKLFTSVGVGVILYFILIYLLKVEELNWFIGIIQNRLKTKNV